MAGRQVTGRRDALVSNATGQIAGTLRAATVLAFTDYSDKGRDELVRKALDRLKNDADHAKNRGRSGQIFASR
jgi:hypothetical protein